MVLEFTGAPPVQSVFHSLIVLEFTGAPPVQ